MRKAKVTITFNLDITDIEEGDDMEKSVEHLMDAMIGEAENKSMVLDFKKNTIIRKD